nr:MAG TPA: Tail fiber protein [Bacteriophage sp.]
MGWDEVKKINSDMKVPLDVYQYLNDYRLWGEDSYVYQDKSKLHKLYETTVVSMNDLDLSGEALEYLTTANKHIGKALGSVYGIQRKDTLSTLSTMSAVANSSTAMSAVANSSTAMSAVANSSTAMSAVANSSTAMSAVLNSPNCMYLGDTNLPNCKGAPCNGKFLLVGSPYDKYCVDNCTPNYVSQLNSGYKLIIQSSKFGRVYTKIGVAGIPVNTIFTMLDDYGSGNACIVYKL